MRGSVVATHTLRITSNMYRFSRWLFLLTYVVALADVATVFAAASDGTPPISGPLDVIVHDLKLFVNGTEFFIKAMAYHPTPLGFGLITDGGHGGGGLCSPKMTPWREFKSACFDSDYFDGSSGVDRTPPGPDQWFRPMWQRDFPVLAGLGVNTLRIYNVNPTTKLASETLLSSGWNKILVPAGKDHRPFLDLAHAYGLKVMFPLVADETALTSDSEEMLDQKIKNIIDEVGNHPAVLMWVIGNEIVLDTPAKEPLRRRVNQKMDLARQYTMAKHGRILPITNCVVDLPESYDFLVKNLNVDLFCANAGYRSDSLTDLFTGNPNRKFPGFAKLNKDSNMPLLIGEIGWLSMNNTINAQQPKWFNKVWKDVLKYNPDGCIGGVFFEYSDEKYKQSGPDQTQLGVVEVFPAPMTDGRTSADLDVFVPDIVKPKAIIYEAVMNGTLDGQPMNFNLDVWKYWGRQPAQIPVSNSRPIPAPFTQSGTPQAQTSPTATPPIKERPRASSGSRLESFLFVALCLLVLLSGLLL